MLSFEIIYKLMQEIDPRNYPKIFQPKKAGYGNNENSNHYFDSSPNAL